MNRDLKLFQIRRVTLWWLDEDGIPSYPSTYLIPNAEVNRFITASVRLHFKPGVNPHNGLAARKIWKITTAQLELKGPFWWTTPDLQDNDDPAGAYILDSYHEHTAWIDKELVERWNAEDERAEAEFENDAT